MAHDPNLAADTCIFMEAVAGDGGVHTGGFYWLSPDIQLTGATSGPDKADPGQPNAIDVTCHNKGPNCTIVGGAESITIQIWVARPSIAMAPNDPTITKMIDSIGTPTFGLTNPHTQQFIWTPAIGLPPDHPEAPGHKCLFARSFPDSLVPSATNFFVEDPHVAQHNICIVPCGGPGAAKRPGPCGQDVTTINTNVRKADVVKIAVWLDLDPQKHVREIVERLVKRVKGFERLARRPPKSFQLQLPDGIKAKIADTSKKGTGKKAPGYDALVPLDAAQSIRCRFVADLSGASLGEAFVFHLTQEASDRSPQGGLTVVMVAG